MKNFDIPKHAKPILAKHAEQQRDHTPDMALAAHSQFIGTARTAMRTYLLSHCGQRPSTWEGPAAVTAGYVFKTQSHQEREPSEIRRMRKPRKIEIACNGVS